MSEIVVVEKLVGTTIVINLKETGNDIPCRMVLDVDTAKELEFRLHQVLHKASTPKEQPIGQLEHLFWVWDEERGGNWCLHNGASHTKFVCHNELMKYASRVTKSDKITLELYKEWSLGRVAVVLLSECDDSSHKYPMVLDDTHTDSYYALRGWIRTHTDGYKAYLGVRVETDTPERRGRTEIPI